MKRLAMAWLVLPLAFLGCEKEKPAPKIELITIQVASNPPGAEVRIDGEAQVYTTPFRAQVDPRGHMLELRLPSYQTMWRNIPAAGGDQKVEIDLRRETAAIHIDSTPVGASVSLDGNDVGVTPLYVTDVALGRHKAELRLPGYAKKDLLFELEDSRPRKFHVSLASTMGMVRVLSKPPGAEIWLDGIYKGKTETDGRTPLLIADVEEGEHQIVAKKTSYEDLRHTFHLRRGRSQLIDLLPMREKAGGVIISSEPEGAFVFINGDRRGKTPFPLEEQERGQVRVRLEMLGFDPVERTIDVAPGVTKHLRLEMTRNLGGLSLRTKPPSCMIYLDGKRLAQKTERSDPTSLISKPYEIANLPEGPHSVRVEHPQYTAETLKVLLQKGQHRSLGLVELAKKWLPTHQLTLHDDKVYLGKLERKLRDGGIEFWVNRNVKLEFKPHEIKELKKL